MTLKSLQSYMFAFEDTRSASHRKIPSLYLDRRQNLTVFTCRGRKRLYLICKWNLCIPEMSHRTSEQCVQGRFHVMWKNGNRRGEQRFTETCSIFEKSKTLSETVQFSFVENEEEEGGGGGALSDQFPLTFISLTRHVWVIFTSWLPDDWSSEVSPL